MKEVHTGEWNLQISSKLHDCNCSLCLKKSIVKTLFEKIIYENSINQTILHAIYSNCKKIHQFASAPRYVGCWQQNVHDMYAYMYMRDYRLSLSKNLLIKH